MANFDRYKNNCARIDWAIMMAGSISIYYDCNILHKDLDWLEKHDYISISLDFSTIDSIETFHKEIKKMCNFPEYYGENMSALGDCLLHDLKIPFEGGLVLIFKSFNLFYQKDKTMAHEILERISVASRRRILSGERLIMLIQSQDPHFSPDMVGAYHVLWNRNEFVDKRRIKE